MPSSLVLILLGFMLGYFMHRKVLVFVSVLVIIYNLYIWAVGVSSGYLHDLSGLIMFLVTYLSVIFLGTAWLTSLFAGGELKILMEKFRGNILR